jgi:hypothetical protein
LIGYKYLTYNKFTWRLHQGATIPLSPPWMLSNFTVIDAKRLLVRNSSHLIRWESNFDCKGITAWWHIIKDKREDINDFSKKTRYNIRRGSKKYLIQLCSRDYIIKYCYPIYKKTFSHYKTVETGLNESQFISEIEDLSPNTEFWQILEKDSNKLVGFAENYIEDQTCFYVSTWIIPEALRLFAGYSLFHEMNKYYLNENQFKYVSDGARSISHQSGIHEYLVNRYHFRKAYAQLNIHYSPGLKYLIILFYPFRRMIPKLRLSIFQKAQILLTQEQIRRSF